MRTDKVCTYKVSASDQSRCSTIDLSVHGRNWVARRLMTAQSAQVHLGLSILLVAQVTVDMIRTMVEDFSKTVEQKSCCLLYKHIYRLDKSRLVTRNEVKSDSEWQKKG